MKTIIEATIALFLFRPYTVYPRWMEISYGVMAWIAVGINLNALVS